MPKIREKSGFLTFGEIVMLKFESVELLGFKSFADKTRVVFDNQVTSIVGPNGCGKSNLSDAIGWVLGLQSAHGLRGQVMEDVVFNGTSRRKASGMARVSLTIAREGDQKIVLNGEELDEERLEITRKLFRDGESTYWINHRRCRQKDVHRFLDESGLGFAPYALIAQGRIDWFLRAKAMERRSVIEEAAQISGYRSRRRNAELKLDMAQQNLLRVNDIIVEVERQLRSLKRQAGRAGRYRDLKQEFEQVLRAKFALESADLAARATQIERELKDLAAAGEASERAVTQLEAAYKESLRKRDEIENRRGALRERRSQLQLEADRAAGAKRYQTERILSTEARLKEAASEEVRLSESLERNRTDLERLREEEQTARDRHSAIELTASERAALVQELSEGAKTREREADQRRKRLMETASRKGSLDHQKEQVEHRLESEIQARDEAADNARLLGEALEEARTLFQKAQETSSEQQAHVDNLAGELQESSAQESARRQEIGQILEERQEVQGRLIASRERLQSLEELELSRSQYSQGVQKLLQHLAHSEGFRSGGTLADFIETRPEFEQLVEDFLDEELEFVLVDSLDDAVRGISEVKSLKSGRCTFMSLRSHNGFGGAGANGSMESLMSQEGVFGTLVDILQMKPDVRDAFQRALPQQAGALVVSDLDCAFQLAHSHPGHTFLTLQGEAWTPTGLLTASAAPGRKLGLLGLKRQKRDLEKKSLQLRRDFDRLQQRHADAETRLAQAAQLRAATSESLHEAEKEMVRCTNHVDRQRADVQRREDALQKSLQQARSREREVGSLQERRQQIAAEITGLDDERQEDESRLNAAMEALEKTKSESEAALAALHDIRTEQRVLAEKLSSLKATRSRILDQKSDLERRLESSRKQAEDDLQIQAAAEQALRQAQEDLTRLEGESEKVGQELRSVESLHAQWQAGHPRLESDLQAKRLEKTALQQRRSELDVESARVDTRLQNLRDQCREQLFTDLEAAASGVDLSRWDLEEVRRSYAECKERLDAFGPINMTALEEYQQNEERFEFLSGQREDIERSIADTTKAIQDLNRRSREKFKDAFEAIDGHFQALFRKLFGGGDCGMRLLDEEDLLESGLDVFAQPPGKKLQNVSLLSGGEKALTGLALLMALFQYRPSRFCILDEVDAPLDDANVLRFCRLIEEMSEKTQFIIITHNKRTMEIARSIFGVTMQEAGVSQVVSVRF